MMMEHTAKDTQGGGRSGTIPQVQTASQRRDTNPSNNGINELIANLDHELLDVRVRAVKCILRKLECGIVSSDSLKERVDLLDRCRRWLSQVQETLKPVPVESSDNNGTLNSNNNLISLEEVEGVEIVVELLFVLSKHKEFRDLLRKENVDNLLVKLQPYLSVDKKVELQALVNSIVVGQYELSYQGSPTEWLDNKTCPTSARPSEMYSSRNKQFSYATMSFMDDHQQPRPSPPRGDWRGGDSDSSRNTPETSSFPKKSTSIPLTSEDGWMTSIPFFVPSVQLNGTDKRVVHSTVDSLSGTNDSLVLMTLSFVRDTLSMDYPSELFLQESSLLLSLAQVTVSRWTDRRIPYIAVQTLMKISNHLRFRFTQLNFSEQYEVPTPSMDLKPNYYDYDGMSYSSRTTPKASSSVNPTTTDALIENFVQLFKSFSRALLYTSYDLHIWPAFESFAFTLLKCVSIFPVDSKGLTMNMQGILMELAHIWERKSDYHTTVGLCLVSGSILNCMKIHNETFIVSKDVRSMLRGLSYSPIIRNGWPEIFENFVQYASMFDPSAGIMSDSQKNGTEEDSENQPKRKILKLLYTIQNASGHEEVLDSVDSLRDVLVPISLNVRQGKDSLTYVLQDAPWRDTFYRFLCVEPTTEGDEGLLGRVLDLFTYVLQNVMNACTFKWITPLCCEKSCTTLKLLGNAAMKNELTYGGTALPDLLRSLLNFYEVVLNHGKTLVSDGVKWEIFQIYAAILHGLEQQSYANFALLSAISKQLSYLSSDPSVQAKIKDNAMLCVAMIHRITDAFIVLEANGSLFEGYKNSCCLYYLSVFLVHMLVAVMKEENYKKFKGDWIERCGRVFHIFTMSSDSRVKCQAFQIAEILTSNRDTKVVFCESSFKDSMVSVLEMSYSSFIEQKYPACVKFRAGKVVLHILNDETEKFRLNLNRRLQQDFTVLVDLSRMASRVLWNVRLSDVINNASKAAEKSSENITGTNFGVLFITPRVLSVLCKILITYIKGLAEESNALHEVMSSGISQMMFRIILRNPLKTETNSMVWLDCCCALSSVLEALINLSKLDRSISVILIGEKRCLSVMFDLLDVETPASCAGINQEKAEEALNALCGNILNLTTILCCDAGNNFEDLERVAWSHQQVLFARLSDWLKITTPVISRRAAISFTQGFLSVLSHRTKQDAVEQPEQSQSPASHPFLCRNWKDDVTYGQGLCADLINILKNSVDNSERISAMKCLSALFTLSPSSVKYAVQDNDIVSYAVQKLHNFGCKYFETKGPSFGGGKKVNNVLHAETISLMELLSSLFYVSGEAKKFALKYNFPDILHKIFGWWNEVPEPTLLLAYIETLLNFTEEFPAGALALTMTSNVVGVAPRRVPTQQSIFMEILGILEKELSNVESNPNLKTVEMIFELEKNICFVQECRNILLKSPVILFVRKLHWQETKKWGNKQNSVKVSYLDFLVHATAHADVQTCIAKIPEGLEILVQLVESDHPPASTLSLKVLRNLCFQPANRGRLLSENLFIPSLSNKLLSSTDLEEIEHASISLWALIANYEKGRLNAKKSYCGESILKALERIRKMEQTATTTNSGDAEDVSRLITLLETVQKLLGAGTTANFGSNRNVMNSRASSVSQL